MDHEQDASGAERARRGVADAVDEQPSVASRVPGAGRPPARVVARCGDVRRVTDQHVEGAAADSCGQIAATHGDLLPGEPRVDPRGQHGLPGDVHGRDESAKPRRSHREDATARTEVQELGAGAHIFAIQGAQQESCVVLRQIDTGERHQRTWSGERGWPCAHTAPPPREPGTRIWMVRVFSSAC